MNMKIQGKGVGGGGDEQNEELKQGGDIGKGQKSNRRRGYREIQGDGEKLR